MGLCPKRSGRSPVKKDNASRQVEDLPHIGRRSRKFGSTETSYSIDLMLRTTELFGQFANILDTPLSNSYLSSCRDDAGQKYGNHQRQCADAGLMPLNELGHPIREGGFPRDDW